MTCVWFPAGWFECSNRLTLPPHWAAISSKGAVWNLSTTSILFLRSSSSTTPLSSETRAEFLINAPNSVKTIEALECEHHLESVSYRWRSSASRRWSAQSEVSAEGREKHGQMETLTGRRSDDAQIHTCGAAQLYWKSTCRETASPILFLLDRRSSSETQPQSENS